MEVDLAGRYYERTLPHWQPEGRELFLTWRLSGSLPRAIMERLRVSATVAKGERFREYDSALDSARSGPLWLKDQRVADVVVEGIRHIVDKGMCQAHAWVVMPNHVHLMIEPRAALAAITKTLKGTTARQANAILGGQDDIFGRMNHLIIGFATKRNSPKLRNILKEIQ